MLTKNDVLKQYFGHDSFREGQGEVIDAIMSGRDALCIMPTGAGKSVCYQIPALMLDGVTIVISPLISLMKDQVESLVQSGIAAAFVNSSLTSAQYARVLENITYGRYKLIYVAPERLESPDFLAVCRLIDISLVVVDEAHCVSQWGQDFRPSYLRIRSFYEGLRPRPVVGAFTATATDRVRDDIRALLGLRDPFLVTTGFDRPNLFWSVERPSSSKKKRLLELVREREGQSGIVYAATRKNVEDVCEMLQSSGISATRYHAGLTEDERHRNQEDFVYGRSLVMVATNAFGMGIDKSDVSFVIHFNMPKDVESYYQEAGRAGRDGERADCILLYSQQDVLTARMIMQHSKDDAEPPEPDDVCSDEPSLHERELERLRQMTFYCTTGDCLRHYILNYFGEDSPATCGNCSNCCSHAELVDITIDAQKIMSCIIRTRECYGKNLISAILRGARSKRLDELGLRTQTTHGLMSDMSDREVRDRIDFLEEKGYLCSVGGDYPVLKTTPKCTPVLRGREKVYMKVFTERRQEEKQRRREVRRRERRITNDDSLMSQLKHLRARLAREQGVPPYIIFTNAALSGMCEKRPKTAEEFLEVNGVGRARLERYGEEFMRLIREYDGE